MTIKTTAASLNQTPTDAQYKWYILALVILTNITTVAIPTMGMSVLAKEISDDLQLTLVQVGIVWGVGALPAIFTSLLAGAIGDKIGPKKILMVAALLAGLLGAARGLVQNFISMTLVVIVLGGLIPFITSNGLKTSGLWFPYRKLGLANGLLSMGMAFGFLVGSMFSATVLSPLLGGWRNVFILYGVLGALLSIPWYFTRTAPRSAPATDMKNFSIRRNIAHIARLKDVWFLGMTLFGISGCIQGLLGYLPLYLRTIGWEAVRADSTLAAFHTISMIFVLPIALWSDRLGSRKRLLWIASLMVAAGTGLLTFATGGLVWVAALMVGLVRDAFMAIFLTMVIESEGVGPAYAGTAVGLVMAISGVGNFLAPPLGNSMANLRLSAPFALWAALAVMGMVFLSLVRTPTRE